MRIVPRSSAGAIRAPPAAYVYSSPRTMTSRSQAIGLGLKELMRRNDCCSATIGAPRGGGFVSSRCRARGILVVAVTESGHDFAKSKGRAGRGPARPCTLIRRGSEGFLATAARQGEKPTASRDQTRQPSAEDRARDWRGEQGVGARCANATRANVRREDVA